MRPYRNVVRKIVEFAFGCSDKENAEEIDGLKIAQAKFQWPSSFRKGNDHFRIKDLKMNEGDRIIVVKTLTHRLDMTGQRWCIGYREADLNRNLGYFPADFVKIIFPASDPVLSSPMNAGDELHILSKYGPWVFGFLDSDKKNQLCVYPNHPNIVQFKSVCGNLPDSYNEIMGPGPNPSFEPRPTFFLGNHNSNNISSSSSNDDGEPQRPIVSTWHCGQCEHLNAPSHAICAMCFVARCWHNLKI